MTSWHFERVRLAAPGWWGAGAAGPTARPPKPLGLQAALPHSPSHLQTTLVLTQPARPQQLGFHMAGPGPDPSPPGRAGTQSPLVGPKCSPQRVFRESRQQRPALSIKVFQRSEKEKK